MLDHVFLKCDFCVIIVVYELLMLRCQLDVIKYTSNYLKNTGIAHIKCNKVLTELIHRSLSNVTFVSISWLIIYLEYFDLCFSWTNSCICIINLVVCIKTKENFLQRLEWYTNSEIFIVTEININILNVIFVSFLSINKPTRILIRPTLLWYSFDYVE